MPGVRSAEPALAVEPLGTAGTSVPRRLLIYGPAGCGKTTLAASFPAAVVVPAGRALTPSASAWRDSLPEEACELPPAESFDEVVQAAADLLEMNHSFETAVFDPADAVERMCHQMVCQRDFDGEWGAAGFAGFQRGVDAALGDWQRLLDALERLSIQRGMTVIFTAGARAQTFRRASGRDFDRAVPNLHAKTWQLTQAWCDLVGYLTIDAPAGEGDDAPIAPARRVLWTEHRPAHDAKNHHQLPACVGLGSEPAQMFARFSLHLAAATDGDPAASSARRRGARRRAAPGRPPRANATPAAGGAATGRAAARAG